MGLKDKGNAYFSVGGMGRWGWAQPLTNFISFQEQKFDIANVFYQRVIEMLESAATANAVRGWV